MKETHSDLYIDKRGRRYRRINFEKRVELRRRYRANIPKWRQPQLGYLVALPLVALAIFSTLYLSHILGGHFVFPGSLAILAVLVVALFWGVGPALFAIVLSVLSLDYYVVLPLWHFDFLNWEGMSQLLPFVVAGLTTALITAQRERARLNALAAEQELASYTEELEKINSRLENTNQLKDRFLSIASHELKTPITTIRGQAQLVLRRLSKQKRGAEMVDITTSLERINEQTGRLTALVDELLDVSSIRTGKARLRKRTCDLREICREVIEDQRILTGRKIVLNMPATPVLIEGDSDRLTQVVVNLVTNALKYSPEESAVEVEVQQNNGDAVLRVRDYGRGIAKDQQERIFETFYRSPDAEASSKKGLGLGLAIAKDIVERHAGRIWCESVPGQGSTFVVELPPQAEHSIVEA